MKKALPYLWMFLLMFNFSCSEEESVRLIPTDKEKNLNNEFIPCECTALPVEGFQADYIKAEINGVPICFDVLVNFQGSFGNMLKYGNIINNGAVYYDNLHMIRNAENSKWQIAIFLENTNALKKIYPYNLPRSNPEYCEIGSVQLNDTENYTSCTFCPENKYNYHGAFSGSAMKMTATSIKNNVFKGVFSGTMKTGSGKIVKIYNGEFQIGLKLENVNLKLIKDRAVGV